MKRINLVALFISLFSLSAQAEIDNVDYPMTLATYDWDGIIVLTGGVNFTSNVPPTQTIPILNPITDSFFIYEANQTSSTRAFGGLFLGVELFENPTRHWAWQIGISGYYSPNEVNGVVTQGADFQSTDQFNYSYDVVSNQILLETKLLWVLPTDNTDYISAIDPYIMGGAGVAVNTAKNFSVFIEPQFITFTNTFNNNTTTCFSYRLGIGLDTEIGTAFRLGVGYQFAHLGKVAFQNGVIDVITTENELVQSNWETHGVVLQLGYVFY